MASPVVNDPNASFRGRGPVIALPANPARVGRAAGNLTGPTASGRTAGGAGLPRVAG